MKFTITHFLSVVFASQHKNKVHFTFTAQKHKINFIRKWFTISHYSIPPWKCTFNTIVPPQWKEIWQCCRKYNIAYIFLTQSIHSTMNTQNSELKLNVWKQMWFRKNTRTHTNEDEENEQIALSIRTHFRGKNTVLHWINLSMQAHSSNVPNKTSGKNCLFGSEFSKFYLLFLIRK